MILNDYLTLTVFWLVSAAFLAGFVDALVGGGGLIQIPALFTAFPRELPATLLGTNKLSAFGGTLFAATRYLRQVHLPKRFMLVSCLCALFGSFSGAWVVTRVSAEFLRQGLPFILFALLVFTLVNKQMGLSHRPQLTGLKAQIIIVVGSLGIGFYDGFFGPGTGAFLMFLCVYFLGFDILHGAAATKLVNCVTNLAALALFIPTGYINWNIALLMMFFNILGGISGSSLAIAKGSGLIRYFFVLVVLALTVKTADDSFGILSFLK